MFENMTILAVILTVALCIGLIFFGFILSNMIIGEGKKKIASDK